jgi:UDPglucose 6-dehydrogenase
MSTKTLGKPESHSDVVNKHPSTLLIGYGWVGQQVHKYFTEADYYTPHDGLRDNSGQLGWDVGFVSVPSPMKEDGSCDTSYVEAAVEQWYFSVKLFIIRSTVTPGTIAKLSEKYPDNLFVMQPEYLGETLGHPMLDVDRHNPIIILGGTKEATRKASEAWSKVLHADAEIRQTDGLTAEFCKYMENCFLATKVTFVNDWARLCKEVGVDFLALRECWLADPRIGRSHTLAYEDNPGFSGKCLPKDLNSIAHYARGMGRPLELVEAVLKINAKMRENYTSEVALLPVENPKL